MNPRTLTAALGMAILFLTSAQPCRASGSVIVRGLLDIVASENDARFLNTMNPSDSNFDPLRARLFIDAVRGDTQVFVQFLASQEGRNDFRLYGAYVMHRLFDGRDVWIEAGKVPVHDGIWASHTYSNKNPLVSVPLGYFWKSSLPSRMLPTGMEQLLASRGQGQTGVYYADSTGARGAPYSATTMLYDNCWDYGLYSLGTLGSVEYSVGVTYGAPGAPLATLDTNEDIAVHAKVGYAITPGLRAWVSAARGAYLSRDVSPYLPAGKTVNDYYQEILIVSADWRWRHLYLMGEVFFNHFDTPLRADGLDQRSFYVQGTWTVTPGWDLSARYDEIRFEEVDSDSGPITWDRNVYRMESGVAYHASRSLVLKAVVQASDVGAGWTSDHVVPAIQMSFSF